MMYFNVMTQQETMFRERHNATSLSEFFALHYHHYIE